MHLRVSRPVARLLISLLLVGIAAAGLWQTALAQDQPPANPVYIYFFWGEGCPHCAAAKPFLEDLAERYPGVEIKAYEVFNNLENRKLWDKMGAAYGFEPSGVPTIFIGDQYWVGYGDNTPTPAGIEQAVAYCVENGCPDPMDRLASAVTPAPQPTPVAPNENELVLPIIGKVDLSHQSLAISTALIAFVDGFNPCSLWVLSMLLALTLHTGSRKKVLIIGLIFLTVTALIYALFIAGLFTVLTVLSISKWVQVLVGLLALFFAVINIKDYFWYKEGVSLTIADDKKPGLFKRIRAIMDGSQSIWGMAGATVVMAAGVSLVEFSCTAGFPVLWTGLVSAQQVTPLTFVLLLLMYMIIYQLDELVIFTGAVVSMKASRVEEKHGRILKLISGTLMLALAIVMLVNPSLMNQMSSALWIFAAAFAAVGLILLVHRVILPSFGIWIGTEKQTHSGRRKAKKVVKARQR
ncbi:MAG TPA: glutaredoxin domain-containing protein [Anaerolineaceae bacterium]|nr:glutaredoxin domain-containing protein [Anaerolineaceae bacterium]